MDEKGHANEGFRKYALRNEAPVSFCQPSFIAPKTDRYVLRRYYCPRCAAMFETEVALKDAEILENIKLK